MIYSLIDKFLIDLFIDQFLIKHWPESSKIMHIVCPVFHNLLQFLWCLWRLFYWVIQCITVLCSYLENRNWSLKRKLHTNPSSISIHFHGNNALHALYYNKFFMVSGSFTFDCRHTGKLKCANSLSLVYTSKRCSYRFVYYVNAFEIRKIWHFIECHARPFWCSWTNNNI